MSELVKRWRGVSVSMFRLLRVTPTDQLFTLLEDASRGMLEGLQNEEEEEEDFFNSHSVE